MKKLSIIICLIALSGLGYGQEQGKGFAKNIITGQMEKARYSGADRSIWVSNDSKYVCGEGIVTYNDGLKIGGGFWNGEPGGKLVVSYPSWNYVLVTVRANYMLDYQCIVILEQEMSFSGRSVKFFVGRLCNGRFCGIYDGYNSAKQPVGQFRYSNGNWSTYSFTNEIPGLLGIAAGVGMGAAVLTAAAAAASTSEIFLIIIVIL